MRDMHNGFDDWDFEERFSTNGDELYEIESNYYMEQEDFHAQQAQENESDKLSSYYLDEEFQRQQIRDTQSAPGHLSCKSNCNFDDSVPESSLTKKFLDYTDDCGSEELVKLLDSTNFETIVLYANYNTRNFAGPKEHYSSESDSEIMDYIQDSARRRKKGRNLKPCTGVKSGYTLTRHHKGDFFGNDKNLDKSSRSGGFGEASVMRNILTRREQQMLGVDVSEVAPIMSTPSTRAVPKSPKCFRITPRTQDEDIQQELNSARGYTARKSGRTPSTEVLKKYDGVLRIESIKIVQYDDPSAAGDFICHDSQDQLSKLENKFPDDLGDRAIITATKKFKEAVLQRLPIEPKFVLGKPSSSPRESIECFKCIKLNSNDSPKPYLHVSSTANLDKSCLPVPSLPSLELCRWSGVHNLNNVHLLEYETPKFTRQWFRPAASLSHRQAHFSPTSWAARRPETYSKFSPTYQTSCGNLSKLGCSSCDDVRPQISQSETKWSKERRNKKIQFAYTSHESFFNSTRAERSQEIENCYTTFENASVSTTLSRSVCSRRSDASKEILSENISSADSASLINYHVDQVPNVDEDVSISDDSSAPSLAFIAHKSSSCTISSSTTWVVCQALQPLKINSASYTILQPSARSREKALSDNGSSAHSESSSTKESFFTATFSDSSNDSTFDAVETPSHRPSVDSDEHDCCFDEIEMTDRMAFKFLLDENGSEVEISVTLPFSVPTTDLPIESPLMAAAVLKKAQELVLANAGFIASDDEDSEAFEDKEKCWTDFKKEGVPTKRLHAALQGPISMDKLLCLTTTTTHNCAKDGRVGVAATELDNVENVAHIDEGSLGRTLYTKKIINFLCNIFLCKCCRGQLKVFPENINVEQRN